jgi:tRNA (uracil-5-)-methyltransferase TRM9
MNPFEEEYVKCTYDIIAKSFDRTRFSIWKCVLDFLEHVEKDAHILDVGCGNGKNIKYLVNSGYLDVHGCDFSEEFVKICQKKSLDVICGNILYLPYSDKCADNVICIAVIHHLSTEEHRIAAIKELIRITKVGGKILITVSSYEHPFYKEYDKINEQDVLIPWKNSYGDIEKMRYYHLFMKDELENLCKLAGIDPEKITSSYELGNYVVSIIA